MATFTILPKKYNFTRNPIYIKGTPVADASLTRIDLIITIGTTEIVLSETPDLTNYPGTPCPVEFEISSIIDEYMNNEFTAPVESGTGINAVTGSPLAVSIEYREYEEGDLINSGDLEDINNGGDPYLFLQGGVTWRSQFAANDFLIDYYNAMYGTSGIVPFLSWQGTDRIADSASTPTLYFFLKDVSLYNHYIRVIIYNGTSVVAQATVDPQAITPNVIYCAYVGYTALGIAAILAGAAYTGDITHWKVTIGFTDGSSEHYQATEAINFYYDQRNYRQKTRLQFQNSLNGFDDVIFTGDLEVKDEIQRNTAFHEATSDSTFPKGMRKNYASIGQSGKKVNAGNQFSKAQILAFRELLLSPRIFEQEDGQLLPVELTEKTKEMIATAKFTQGFVLEFKYLFTEHSYTPKGKLI